MALTDENSNGSMIMPVTPMGNSGNGFGDCFGGNGFWILLLFLLLGGNGWGNGFGGGFGGGNDIYPWMNQSNQINGGFRDQMLNTSINGIQNGITSGFGDVQTSLCNGFAGVNATINGGFAGAEASANARQMANMNQAFAAQTAMSQGFNGLQAQFADCCCGNKLGLADLKYTVATENCADRTQSMQNTRDIIDSQTRSTQAILDKLCALELDGVKSQLAQAQRENVGLQNQLNMATMQASQTAQTAQILAGQAAEIDGVYNRLKNCPVPSMPVYGNQPIFTCGNNGGCGCGCGTV
jgi:hypothetical protein